MAKWPFNNVSSEISMKRSIETLVYSMEARIHCVSYNSSQLQDNKKRVLTVFMHSSPSISRTLTLIITFIKACSNYVLVAS